MKCAFRSLTWNWFLFAYVMLIAALLFTMPAHAASTPPTIDIPSITVMENAGSAPVVIVKAKASSYSKISVQTVDGTAKASVDYKPVNVTLTLANNATSTRLPIAILDNATYQGTRQFALKVAILRFGQVPASYTPITVTISDDEAPPPPPPPVGGLSGEAAIADNFDASKALMQVGGAGAAGDGAAAFRLFCTAGQLLRDDPLVLPGQAGASHLHQFFGNTGTNASSNYQSLRTSGSSTCGTVADAPVNRSSYWFPAMLDGIGHVVKPDFISVYYKRNSASDPMCRPLSSSYQSLGQCTDLPNGIRFVVGTNMKTMERPGGSIHFYCYGAEDGSVGSGTASGDYQNLADLANAGCPVGAQVVIAVNSPNCWDGVNLDSADHRSHMSYANGPWYAGQLFNACTADHPYPIPDMELLVHFTVDANLNQWRLSSDDQMEQQTGMKVIHGSTMHADYWEAWSPTVKAAWHHFCINGHLSCSSGALGDGSGIIGTDVPNGGFPRHQLVPVP